MCKYLKINTKQLLVSLLLLSGMALYSQEIKKPVLEVETMSTPPYALCASSSFNNFNLTFEFEDNTLQFQTNNNQFSIQISDENGDFTNARQVGPSINGQNLSFFGVNATFDLPTDVYAGNYQVRIKSSNPEVFSPPSTVFEAYYGTSQSLILNNREDVILCNGSPTEISVNVIDPTFTYQWFKDLTIIPGETGTSITVSEEGEYYAQINYGTCSGLTGRSNRVLVTELNSGNVLIEGNNTVEICANETYTLTANVNDPLFIYNWYKDGVLIVGADTFEYTTPVSNQFGVYHVEVGPSTCLSRSQDVTIQQRSDIDFPVDITPPAIRVILPNETIPINVTHGANSPTIKWFKDGVEIPGVTGDTYNAFEPGVYCAEVTDNSTTCPVSKKSAEYTILGVDKLIVEIRPSSDYIECEVAETTLSIVGIRAEATDGNTYDLTQDQIDSLTLQWAKDGTPIPGANTDRLDIASYLDNGAYTLNASIRTLSSDSEPLDIKLGLIDQVITSSSPSNVLCPGGTIMLSINTVTGFTYTWFKDGVALTVTDPTQIEVTEIGVYSVTFDGFDCQKDMPSVDVIEFDEDVLEVSPSTTAILEPGETVTVEASGADAYEWYDSDGNLLSTNELLTVNSLGVYTLIGRVGDCDSTREINVVEDDGKLIIPNVVSPFNNDGANDTWELPNRLAFQPDVQVIIFNSRGKEILNTTDYQNNWPEDNNIKDGSIFYFKVIKNELLIKAGTISILQ